VQSKESGERSAADNRTAQQQVYQRPTDDRYAAHDRGADTQAPVRVLKVTNADICHSDADFIRII